MKSSSVTAIAAFFTLISVATARADWPQTIVRTNGETCSTPSGGAAELLFDSSGHAVVAWQESSPCFNTVHNYWGRRTLGQWAVNEVSHNPNVGTYTFRGNISLALQPDGTPWMSYFSGWSPGYIVFDRALITMVTVNLASQPQGPGIGPINYVNTYDVCTAGNPFGSLAIPPGGGDVGYCMAVICGCGGGLLVNGTSVHGNGFIFRPDLGDGYTSGPVAYKIGPSGSTHVVYSVNRCNIGSLLGHCNGAVLNETVIEAGFDGTVALAIDATGVLHVAGIRTNGSVVHYSSTTGGTTWSAGDAVAAASQAWIGSEPAIAIDSAGHPTIAYWQGSRQSITVQRFNGSAWSAQTAATIGTFTSGGVHLAFDPAGSANVFFYDPATRHFVLGTEPRACPADFNADGTLDPDDLADFIGAFFAIPPGTGSDFNGDGNTDPDDLADFIGAFFAGCP